jgi:hypothetical protein
MGQPHARSSALLLVAAFSRYEEALQWARRRVESAWGTIVAESPRFEFRETPYYDATMGPDQRKVFWALERPFDPSELASIKLLSNRWEEEYAALGRHAEPRPLNLDPGYLTLAKLVLASTKDFTHRIYLSQGIFAEVTLFYRRGRWEHHEWTFPDYRRADYQQFFSQLRDDLHRQTRGDCPR